MQFEHFVSSFLQNIMDNQGEALRAYNTALQRQIQHLHFLTILICKTENVNIVLEHHEAVQMDLDSGQISWQDEDYFKSWQAKVLQYLKLGDGEVYDNVKEEAKESFPTDTTEDLVCIKFKIEKPSHVKQKMSKWFWSTMRLFKWIWILERFLGRMRTI